MRVGILRNLNLVPRPPARRPALTGRWPSLRSSRRPPETQVETAAQEYHSAATNGEPHPFPEVAVQRGGDGRVQRIDIAGLMASVNGVGTDPAARLPYAATMRPDGVAAPEAPKRRSRPSILSPEAWNDEDEDDDLLAAAFETAKREHDAHHAAPGPPSRRGLWIALIGLVLALAIALLVPGWVTL